MSFDSYDMSYIIICSKCLLISLHIALCQSKVTMCSVLDEKHPLFSIYLLIISAALLQFLPLVHSVDKNHDFFFR